MPRKVYKIDVTHAHLTSAIRGHSSKCAVARAIAQQIDGAAQIQVDTQTVRFSLEGRRLQYLTPPVVAAYVINFDAGDDIDPFTFNLRKPIVTRAIKSRIDPSEPRAPRGSPEHRRKCGQRHPPETMAFVGSRGDVTNVPVVSNNRVVPTVGRGKQRTYGHRLLRINRDRFADEPEGEVS